MRTTLFTGAGASCAIGYPLTSQLMPLILQGLKDKDLFKRFNPRKDFDQDGADRLRGYLNQLMPGLEAANEKDLPLITDVFSLVEYSLVSGEALPVGGHEDLRQFRDLLKQAIVSVLLDSFLGDWDTRDPLEKKQKATFDKMTRWIAAQGSNLGMVTTNYDIGLEHALYSKAENKSLTSKLDLGFEWRHAGSNKVMSRPSDPSLRVYKLHGSLDVLRCSLCGHVYFNNRGTIIHQAFRKTLDANNTCACNSTLKLEAHIVAPSLVRDIRDANLLSIWRSALEWMRTSKRWIIVGYSLPPEDLAIRSLLVRAYAGASKKPKVVVVQHSDAEKARYQMLFPDCDYRTGGLEAFLASEP
jgi:NAD-dependent SIR2 family protein deacetylase